MSTFISRWPGWLSWFSDSLRSRRFRDRIPVGKIYRTRPAWPCDPPSFLYNVFFLFFVCDTRADFVSLQVCHRKIKRNYPGNECFRQGENLFTRKIFGASGYISDSKRNAEGLLTTADNGEHTERSIKYSQSDNYVKI